MAQSVKLGNDVMNFVRRESERQSRSVAGQITHWLRIGRAVEICGTFDHARITAILAGQGETTALSGEEKEVWLEAFTERLAQPGPKEDAFYAERRQFGRGVGLDAAGNLVRATPTDPAADIPSDRTA